MDLEVVKGVGAPMKQCCNWLFSHLSQGSDQHKLSLPIPDHEK